MALRCAALLHVLRVAVLCCVVLRCKIALGVRCVSTCDSLLLALHCTALCYHLRCAVLCCIVLHCVTTNAAPRNAALCCVALCCDVCCYYLLGVSLLLALRCATTCAAQRYHLHSYLHCAALRSAVLPY